MDARDLPSEKRTRKREKATGGMQRQMTVAVEGVDRQARAVNNSITVPRLLLVLRRTRTRHIADYAQRKAG